MNGSASENSAHQAAYSMADSTSSINGAASSGNSAGFDHGQGHSSPSPLLNVSRGLARSISQTNSFAGVQHDDPHERHRSNQYNASLYSLSHPPLSGRSPPTTAYTHQHAMQTPTSASRGSPSRNLDDTTPTLADDTGTLSNTGDASLSSELSFSPFRLKNKLLQSSPGGQKTFDEANSFFSGFSALHSQKAPLESTPRKPSAMAAALGPTTLPRSGPVKRWNKVETTDSGYQEAQTNEEAQKTSPAPAGADTDEVIVLRMQLRESERKYDQLSQWCQELIQEVANAKQANKTSQVDTMESPTAAASQTCAAQPYHVPDAASMSASPAPSGAIWTAPRSSVPTFFPPTPTLQATGADWTNGRLTPVPMDGSASPSMNYIGLSLINSMQAQLQSGTDGQVVSPGTPLGRAASASPVRRSSGHGPAQVPTYFTAVPGMSDQAAYAHSLASMGGSLPSAWIQHQQRQAAALAAASGNGTHHHAADRSLPGDLLRGQGGSGTNGTAALPLRPRTSTPAANTPAYMPGPVLRASAGSNANSSLNGAHDAVPMRVTPTMHPPPPVEVLVARALSGQTQDMSIILQQHLKSNNPEKQATVIRAIRPHVMTFAEDKHGNFLVQRAIGVDRELAWDLRGNFVRLALSQYGCHVVQRALLEDEALQKQIVEELLSRNLLESLTSRNAVHVWAKVLEIRWSEDGFRRHVFQTINQAMLNRWADTAMQETGSIVVQNLFESAQEDEKRDCVSEILARLPECAANQWGVWVVQHIIEHGSPESRKQAFRNLLTEAAALSLAQFGQKAIMTALKHKDPDFIAGYVDQLCDGTDGSAPNATSSPRGGGSSTGSPRRSMLVDVAATPQGLQIMTQLLTTVSRDDRDRIIKAVRKNSVFLKGTKTGLKVVALTERARAFTGY